jgi:two-component system sensor histidine kinase/response regulator
VLRGRRVLVVDDHGTSREVLARALSRWCMEPTAVDAGDAALVALDRAQREGHPFAVVVLDSEMPGMPGSALIDRIRRAAGPSLPLVAMLSAAGGPRAMGALRALGATCVLKPVHPRELRDAIAAALGAPDEPVAAGNEPGAAAACTDLALRVLVAEDNPVNQMLAVRLLERRGHTVAAAADARQAVATLSAAPFDVVLLDVQLPGIDGLDVLAAIRARERDGVPRVPVIGVTAGSMPGDRERCLDAGMDEYVTLPLRAEPLFDAISRVRRRWQSLVRAPTWRRSSPPSS